MKKRIYNQISLSGPLYAYLAVLSPQESVRSQIASLKKELDAIAAIGERNLQSIGHITLIDSLTDDSDLQNTVAKMLHPAAPFLIRLKMQIHSTMAATARFIWKLRIPCLSQA